MISQGKIEALRRHILGQKEASRRSFVYRPRRRFQFRILEEMEESGLLEVVRDGDAVVGTRITPAGVLAYLRAVGRSVGKKSSRDYFVDFIRDNPGFLDLCGPIQRLRVEKYLVLGFMPPLSGEPAPYGEGGHQGNQDG